MKHRMEDVKPYTIEEFNAECGKELFSDFDSIYPHALERVRATVEALEACRSALADLVEYERKRYPPRMGGDEYPPSLALLMKRAREALEAVEGSTTNHKEHP